MSTAIKCTKNKLLIPFVINVNDLKDCLNECVFSFIIVCDKGV